MNAKKNIYIPVHRKIIKPGGLYFGNDENIIFTLLGSCVAVTLWHPVKKLAGMCHVILPKANKNDGHYRYADCAINKFVREINKVKTYTNDYEVGIYGGGSMFPNISDNNTLIIGERNIHEVEKLLIHHSFHIKFKDVGGESARKLTLFRKTGDIGLEHVTTKES